MAIPAAVMRQQIVLRALLDDAANPENADTLWNIVRANKKAVRTDLGPSKQLTYTLAVPGFSNDNVQFATLIDYMYADTAPNGCLDLFRRLGSDSQLRRRLPRRLHKRRPDHYLRLTIVTRIDSVATGEVCLTSPVL